MKKHETKKVKPAPYKPVVTQAAFLAAVKKASTKVLFKLGFRAWDEPDKTGKQLWLFPGNWYNVIPNGFTIYNFNGKPEKFKKGQTDNDTRFNCLPYGIIRKVK